MNLEDARGGSERIFGNLVTTNFFAALGAAPAAGRLFDARDERPVGSAVVVLSHRFWTQHFNHDASVVGQTLQLDGQAFTIVGVAAEGFQGARLFAGDLWLPMNMAAAIKLADRSILTNRNGGWLAMGARLKPGVSMARASAEVKSIGLQLSTEYPDQNRGKGLRVAAWSRIPGLDAPVAVFLGLLMAIATLVLIVACANVAGILLARAAARRREIAVRLAMGAGRRRLVRQLLTETLLVCALAGVAGVLLARGLTSLLVRNLPALPFPIDVSLALDGRVIAFTTGLSFAAALLSGLVPALQASKTDVVAPLKEESGLIGRSRLRSAFVVTQVAFGIVVVIAAGLFVRALERAGTVDPGFDSHDVDLATIVLSTAGATDATGPGVARNLVERVRSLPGVESATMARVFPGGFERIGLGALSLPGAAAGEPFYPAWNIVEPGYFATLRIPVLAGRDFSSLDRAGAQPVAIVSEQIARQFWPGVDPVGRFVLQPIIGPRGPVPGETRALLVVGVAGDIKSSSLVDGLAGSFVYVPLAQQYQTSMTSTMIVAARTTRGRHMANELRTLITSVNPNFLIVTSQTLEDSVALGLVPQRVAASVSASLGLVGLLLAAIGIYGVTAYSVARRTREIGIRIALGAPLRDVVGMVLGQGLSITAIGSVVGLTLAAGVSRLLAAFLYGVRPMDAGIFSGAVILFTVVSLIACYVPARRAARIDAMDALRSE
jgi:predicted permease